MLREYLKRLRRVRLILDSQMSLGNHGLKEAISFDYLLNKEELSRRYLFSLEGSSLRFLDVGGRDGKLTYLLGIKRNLEFDGEMYECNYHQFTEKFIYYGVDLEGCGDRIVQGDICSDSFLENNGGLVKYFDVIYSNNVFEHLRRPWIAARNIINLMKPGAICITVAPFSLRYHEVPEDYFRYTHTGLASLFEDCGDIEILESGYDISGRRNNWQGIGANNDICPEDNFGAWRETWFVVCVFRKKNTSLLSTPAPDAS